MPLYTSLISAGIVAFIISIAFCPLGFYLHLGVKGRSGGTTHLGGLGIVCGFWITVAIILALRTELVDQRFIESNQINFVYWLAGLSLGIYFWGVIGAIAHVHLGIKVTVQIVLAVITAIILLPIQKMSLPLLGATILGDWGILLVSCWIFGVMNALNLLDGLDSLAGGVAVFAMAGVVVLSWNQGNMLFLTLGFMLLMAVGGFLFYNSPPKVHLGEGGSLFLGYLIAVLPLLQIRTSTGEWVLTPLFLVGVPAVNLTRVIFHRFRRGTPFAKPVAKRRHVFVLHLASLVFLGVFSASSLQLISMRYGILTFLTICGLLLVYAHFAMAARPDKSATAQPLPRAKTDHFLADGSDYLGFFLQQAQTPEEIFFVSSVWAKQVQAKQVILTNGETSFSRDLVQNPASTSADRAFNLQRNGTELNLMFEAGFFEQISKQKLAAIKQSCHLILDYFEAAA